MPLDNECPTSFPALKEVVQDMLQTGAGLAVLGMKQLRITILFLDIVNFTAMCESIGTEPLSMLLGRPRASKFE